MLRPLALCLAALALIAATPMPTPAPSGAAPTTGAAPDQTSPMPPAPPDQPAPTGALLQGLDKTTARTSTFVVGIGQKVRFGTLEITLRDCRRRPPEEEPEVAAYLDIDELPPGQAPNEAPSHHLFSGWMFASSPALSALEHPVYDVWLLDCSTAKGSSTKPG